MYVNLLSQLIPTGVPDVTLFTYVTIHYVMNADKWCVFWTDFNNERSLNYNSWVTLSSGSSFTDKTGHEKEPKWHIKWL